MFSLAGQAPVPIPDFSQDDYDDLYDSPMAALKAKCDSAKPIGMVRCGKEELLVIYDGNYLLHVILRAVITDKLMSRIRLLCDEARCADTKVRLRSLGNQSDSLRRTWNAYSPV